MNSPINRSCQTVLKGKSQLHAASWRTHIKHNDTDSLKEIKEWEKIYYANNKHKKAIVHAYMYIYIR